MVYDIFRYNELAAEAKERSDSSSSDESDGKEDDDCCIM